jgi:hypothetical protein
MFNSFRAGELTGSVQGFSFRPEERKKTAWSIESASLMYGNISGRMGMGEWTAIHSAPAALGLVEVEK